VAQRGLGKWGQKDSRQEIQEKNKCRARAPVVIFEKIKKIKRFFLANAD